jgi:hypothetical protein
MNFARNKSTPEGTREIWSWSKMEIHDEPEDEVEVVDLLKVKK